MCFKDTYAILGLKKMEKKIEIWIAGKLPGLNDILGAAKSGNGAGNAYARLKKEWTAYVAKIISSCELEPAQSIFVDIRWIEQNKKRDPDNISTGKKFIFDGMVKSGFLENDGWKQIKGWNEKFEVSCNGKYGCGVSLVITILK
jgi:hypothetical protein